MILDEIRFVDLAAQRARIAPEIDAAIARVLDHGQFIMGPEIAELEQALAAYTGAAHVVTCSSGTDALLMSLMAFGIGRGDAVICPDFTYPATPESIALLGATPIFADVDRASFNLDPGALDRAREAAEAAGLRLCGIIAVDLFGLPADYPRIRDWAAAHGLFVLADAAQGFGASVNGARVGTLAEVTATSFFPAKPLGCYGDGGALFTDDAGMAEALRSIRLHGKSPGGGKYDIGRVGLNGRLDTIQAAILLEKLRIYDDEKSARQALARRYSSELDPAFDPPQVPAATESVWAQYTIKAPAGRRTALQDHLARRGIPTAVYYPKPLHTQPAYAAHPSALGAEPVSGRLAECVLSLPMHPYLTEAQCRHIVGSLNAFAADV